MRRQDSASCLLRPKNSLSQEDLQRLATEAPTATVLTIDRLPSYCTDRLYLLSELQVHANSIRFLCDIGKDSSSGSSKSGSSSSSSSSSSIIPSSTSNNNDTNNNNKVASLWPAFPPSIILYLLWKPNTYPTPRSFADGPLSECVRRCLLANGDEAPSSEELILEGSPTNSHYSPRRRSAVMMEQQQQQQNDRRRTVGVFHTNGEDGKCGEWGSYNANEAYGSSVGETEHQQRKRQQLTRIYVVVDRISSSETNDSLNELPDIPDLASGFDNVNKNNKQSTGATASTAVTKAIPSTASESPTDRRRQQSIQHNTEIKTAEQLARAVASSRFLRTRIEGISVGITSDSRAAPGLEACMDTVERGAKERRLAARDASVRRRRIQMKQKKKQDSEWGDFQREDNTQQQHSMRRQLSLERLRETSPERSPIALVAMQPDDLETTTGDYHHDHSHNHHHHHHHGHSEVAVDVNPKILQCRVSTEWSGKGEHKTFSDRAMRDWRQAWCDNGGYGGGLDADIAVIRNDGASKKGGSNSRPKVPRISRGAEVEEEEECNVDEPISTAMVVVFLAVTASYVWNAYGDLLLSLLFGEVLEKG